MRRWLIAAGLSAVAGATTAQEGTQALEAPPPPPPLQSGQALEPARPGQTLEPEVTIRRSERNVIQEYRQNGKLVMVRVQPKVGPPYHFVDIDGDGSLDYQPGDPVRNNINQWVLKRW